MAKWLTEAESMADIWEGKCTITPLVECKDCKHFKVMEGERLCGAWEEIFYNPVEENGYCYKGERKVEE